MLERPGGCVKCCGGEPGGDPGTVSSGCTLTGSFGDDSPEDEFEVGKVYNWSYNLNGLAPGLGEPPVIAPGTNG